MVKFGVLGYKNTEMSLHHVPVRSTDHFNKGGVHEKNDRDEIA